MKSFLIAILIVFVFTSCGEKSSKRTDNDLNLSDEETDSDSIQDNETGDKSDAEKTDDGQIIDSENDHDLSDEVSDTETEVFTESDESSDIENDENETPDADDSGCIDEQTKTEPCGLNNNGLMPFICDEGLWVENGICADPDVCIINETKTESGTVYICHSGQWKKTRQTFQTGTESDEFGTASVIDSSGNIFVAGYTNGDLDSNAGLGGYDVFLIKFDSDGNKLWTKLYGTNSYDSAVSLAIDTQNNVYIAGVTAGRFPGYYDGGGFADVYVMKIDNDGTVQWTYQYENKIPEEAASVAIDSSGNIYLSGNTSGAIGGNSNIGGYDTFLIKLNSSGTSVWIKQFGSSADDYGKTVAVDSTDNIYVTGMTNGVFAGDSSLGMSDIFIIKFDINGNTLWRKQFGTAGNDETFSSVIDQSNNLFLTGSTNDIFTGETGIGASDIFLTKFSSGGTQLWTDQFGTVADENGITLAVDNSSNIYLSGHTQGSFAGYINQGENDILIAKYDNDGINQWVKQFGSEFVDICYSIAVDNSENIYLSGSTAGSIDGITNAGSFDLFFSIIFAD